MKTRPSYYTKHFTRDQSYVMVEAWCHAHDQGLATWHRGKGPDAIPWILYMSDGAMEEWYSIVHYRWMNDALQRRIEREPRFIHTSIVSYRKQLAVIEPYWRRKTIRSLAELTRFIDRCFEIAPLFTIWYYASTDERTPGPIRNEAMAVRKHDVFFDECDRTFRSAYRRLFPKANGFEATIVRKELGQAPSLRILRERKAHSVVIPGRLPVVTTIDRFLKRNPTIRLRNEKGSYDARTATLTGQSVFPGKVRGTVKVIRRIDQCDEVVNGDILVCPMTTPNLLPAMKRAAAFVTEEGGITCHAAIVAREMKRPCVIGTKIATRVFKDGDRVEVDANHGIVRILKRG